MTCREELRLNIRKKTATVYFSWPLHVQRAMPLCCYSRRINANRASPSDLFICHQTQTGALQRPGYGKVIGDKITERQLCLGQFLSCRDRELNQLFIASFRATWRGRFQPSPLCTKSHSLFPGTSPDLSFNPTLHK